MSEFQRKIELQSLDDFQYLISNITRAAHSKIDIDLPPIQGDDPMRKRVKTIVFQYIEDVLRNISRNITINGLEPDESVLDPILNPKVLATATANTACEIEEYESFNTRLFQQAQKFAREEEDLIEEIALLRRTLPSEIAESVKTEFKEGLEADELALRALKERIEVSSRETQPINFGITALEREEIMEQDWNRSVQGLVGLLKSLPETVAKKVRAEEVERFVSQQGAK